MVNRRSGARGFTLPEVLVVVAVLGILGAAAAPSMSTLLVNQRVRSSGSELLQALIRSRSEAIKRNAEVSLLPSANSWAGGWRIPNPADPSTPIEVHGPVKGATITGPDSVVFQSNGRIRGSASVSFDVSVSGGGMRRCVLVDPSGRPYQKHTAC